MARVSYGAMLGCALPMAWGTAPAPMTPCTWLTRADSVELSRLTDTACPCPVRVRSASAARMPTVACRPVRTSTSATPTLVGWSGEGPVMLMSPPIAWTRRSYPGMVAPAAGPNPVIDV